MLLLNTEVFPDDLGRGWKNNIYGSNHVISDLHRTEALYLALFISGKALDICVSCVHASYEPNNNAANRVLNIPTEIIVL